MNIHEQPMAGDAASDMSVVEEVAYRLRQQQFLSDFGLAALQSTDLDALLQDATRICADALGTELCKLLEYRPDGDELFVRAGVGWNPGIVGQTVTGADLASPAGYAFHTGEPVISNHLGAERRFRTPQILAEHGVRRAINVLVRGGKQPFGVLEVDSPEAHKFTEADLAFMQSMANLLGVAIEKRRTETALSESEANFRTLANSIPQLAWMAEADGSVTWFNQRWLDYTGAPAEAMQGWGWQSLVHPDHAEGVLARLKASFEAGEAWEDVFPLRGQDGGYCWFLSLAEPVRDDSRVLRWFGTHTDITHQREAEERHRLMTQEVSHRVKNSLALVASLLGLQSRSTKSDEARRALEDAHARVQTIAQIHDRLWRQYDAKSVDLCGFLNDLCRKLQETSVEHQLSFHGTSVAFPTDRAISLGLLLNELVTNAFKYAYPEGGGGPITVTLSAADDGVIALEVADRGVGLPDGFDLSRPSRSLGTRLISNTVRQLDATIKATSDNPGARFAVRIPLEAP